MEWAALAEVLIVPRPDNILNFAFTITDKDDSKTLEVDAISEFHDKFGEVDAISAWLSSQRSRHGRILFFSN